MELFEILIYVLIAASLIGNLFKKVGLNIFVNILPIAAASLVPVHLALEGYSRHMVPAYILCGLLLLLSIFLLASQRSFLIYDKVFRRIFTSIILVVFSFSVIV